MLNGSGINELLGLEQCSSASEVLNRVQNSNDPVKILIDARTIWRPTFWILLLELKGKTYFAALQMSLRVPS